MADPCGHLCLRSTLQDERAGERRHEAVLRRRAGDAHSGLEDHTVHGKFGGTVMVTAFERCSTTAAALIRTLVEHLWPRRCRAALGGSSLSSCSMARGEYFPARPALQPSAHARTLLLSCGFYAPRSAAPSLASSQGFRASLPWALAVLPGAPDTFVPRCARASVEVLADSAVEASDVASSMTRVCVDHVGGQLRGDRNASRIALCAGMVSPVRACGFVLSLVRLWARVRRRDMVVNVFAKSFTRKAQCEQLTSSSSTLSYSCTRCARLTRSTDEDDEREMRTAPVTRS